MAYIKAFVTFVLVLLAAYFASEAVAYWRRVPRLEISPELHLGEFSHDQELKLTVGFRNGGSGLLHVDPPLPGCRCVGAKLDRSEYAPGEHGRFEFTLRPAQAPGTDYVQEVVVPTNDPRQPRAIIVIRGHMQDSLYSQPKVIRTSEVRYGKGWQQRVVIRCTDPKVRFKITAANSDLRDVEADIESLSEPSDYGVIIVRQSQVSPVGTTLGKLTIRTDHPRFPQLIVPVEVQVSSQVDVSPKALLFHAGQEFEDKSISFKAESSFELSLNPTDDCLRIGLRPESGRMHWILDVRVDPEFFTPSIASHSVSLIVKGLEHEEQIDVPITIIPSVESSVAGTSKP